MYWQIHDLLLTKSWFWWLSYHCLNTVLAHSGSSRQYLLNERAHVSALPSQLPLTGGVASLHSEQGPARAKTQSRMELHPPVFSAPVILVPWVLQDLFSEWVSKFSSVIQTSEKNNINNEQPHPDLQLGNPSWKKLEFHFPWPGFLYLLLIFLDKSFRILNNRSTGENWNTP